MKNLEELGRTEVNTIIDEYVFNERDRELLKRRILDGIRYEQLAIEFDISVQNAKRIVYTRMQKLIQKIDKI